MHVEMKKTTTLDARCRINRYYIDAGEVPYFYFTALTLIYKSRKYVYHPMNNGLICRLKIFPVTAVPTESSNVLRAEVYRAPISDATLKAT